MTPKVVSIIGVDGTGKTTQSALLESSLRRDGIPTSRAWLRFAHGFSLPVLGVARALGASKRVQTPDGKIGYHQFWDRPIIAAAYVRALRADMALAVRRKVTRRLARGETVICDRFVYDTIVDLEIATRVAPFDQTDAGRRILQLAPPQTVTILLDADTSSLASRRSDLALDRDRETRIQAYRRLARDHGLAVVRASDPINDVACAIWEVYRR